MPEYLLNYNRHVCMNNPVISSNINKINKIQFITAQIKNACLQNFNLIFLLLKLDQLNIISWTSPLCKKMRCGYMYKKTRPIMHKEDYNVTCIPC